MTLSEETTLQSSLAMTGDEPVSGVESSADQSLNQPSTDLDHQTLDTIRELLFGQQTRSQEQRFAQLEAQVEREYTRLRDQLSQRLEALEQSMQNNLQALTQQVQTHQATQVATAADHQQAIAALNHQVAQLSDDLQQKHEELRAILDREVQALHTIDQTDRDQLATLFNDLATSLRPHP